jgi:hypothetical protein
MKASAVTAPVRWVLSSCPTVAPAPLGAPIENVNPPVTMWLSADTMRYVAV